MSAVLMVGRQTLLERAVQRQSERRWTDAATGRLIGAATEQWIALREGRAEPTADQTAMLMSWFGSGSTEGPEPPVILSRTVMLADVWERTVVRWTNNGTEKGRRRRRVGQLYYVVGQQGDIWRLRSLSQINTVSLSVSTVDLRGDPAWRKLVSREG